MTALGMLFAITIIRHCGSRRRAATTWQYGMISNNTLLRYLKL